MGGRGSGPQVGRKTWVEECLIMSAAGLTRMRIIRPDHKGTHHVTWFDDYANPITTWEIFVRTTEFDGELWVGPYGQHIPEHSVFLETTPLPWGGIRWWFKCPLRLPGGVGGEGCSRRCDKLYKLPRRREFGCRRCQQVAYFSSCQSHGSEGLWRELLRHQAG